MQLRKAGRNWVGLCPFHAEKTPSFNVREETGRYKCFGCDASGDVFTFVQEIEHVDFVGAVEQLAAKAGIQLTYTTAGHSKERARRKQLVEAMAQAIDWYHDRLLNDPAARAARDYLRSRGLAGDVARTFKIGWAPDDWDALSRGVGVAPDLLRDNGLAFSNRSGRLQDAFRARVLFPIFNENGEAVGVGGRILPGSTDPAKYKNSPETPIYTKSKTLYGLNWAKADIVAADQAIVCEGYTDVIGFHRAGAAACRRHVRDGVHRGARAAAEAVREPGGAGVRRRRRRPGRRRAVLRVGAEVPGRGQCGPLPGRARTRASWRSPTRKRSPRRSARPRRSSASGSTGCCRVSRRSRQKQRARLGEVAMAVINEHPNSNVRKLYAGQVAAQVGLPVADLVQLAERGVRRPQVHVSADPVAPRAARERRVRGDHAARPGLGLDRPVVGRIVVRRRAVPPGVPRHRRRGRRPRRGARSRPIPRPARCSSGPLSSTSRSRPRSRPAT